MSMPQMWRRMDPASLAPDAAAAQRGENTGLPSLNLTTSVSSSDSASLNAFSTSCTRKHVLATLLRGHTGHSMMYGSDA
eukprot:29154-Eustigmatos_ZCMA.PRE.1